jgi:Fibronectin type 3 domain-containing protein
LRACASDDKIILSWTASPTCSAYNVYKNGELLDENVLSTTYTDNNLTAGEYCYRINGVCNNGELTDFTDLACATVTTCDAPQGLTAETYLSNVVLTWQPTMCDSYRIYMGNTMIASELTDTTFTHHHLVPGTYCYKVKSFCGNEESEPSDQACATIESCYRPVDLMAVEEDANVRLTWGDVVTATSYNVYRNDSLIVSDIDETSYQDNNLLTGDYCYKVTGVCYDGSESGPSSEACVTVAICDAPSDLTVNHENTTITLNWRPSVVAEGYKIYRDNLLVGYTNNTTYVDPEMPIGGYCYYVSAICYTGESDPTETKCDTVYGPCMAPTELTAYEEGDFVVLNWTPSQTVESHQIFVDGVMKLAGVVGDSYALSTENITPGIHCFSLASVCPNGISMRSDSVCISTGGPCDPPTDITLDVLDRKTILTWSSSVNAISYSIIRDSVEVGNTPLTHFIEENLENGIYHYFVKSICSNGESVVSDTLTFEIGTGVDEDLTESCHIYPNPTNGMVNVKMKDMNHISILNVLGQIVYDADLSTDDIFIDMKPYEKGIYMVRVSCGVGTIVKRVVLVP